MGVPQTIELPDIGDYKNVPVVEILVKPGDTVTVDQPLITLESDKATIEVPSPVAGRVIQLLIELGQKVSQGAPVMVLDAGEVAEAGSAVVTAAPPARETAQALAAAFAPTEPLVEKTSPLTTSPSAGSTHASPSVRAFARELGVDLGRVPASGANGRILREDVNNFIKAQISGGSAQTPVLSASGIPSLPTYDFTKFGEIESAPLSRIQKIAGSNLHRNWLNIPHVTNFDNADVTDLEAFRLTLNGEKRDPAVKVTMVAFLIKASALTLAAHPRFNTSLDGETLIQKKYAHVGFAVDTPKGLMVPVIRDCDRKGLLEIAAEMGALSDKARSGKLQPSEMEGGSFSVSSLGGVGGTGFTPIINSPEVAILGAARSQVQPVWDGKDFQPRLIMPISLSWDHRVVDGVAAARFLGHLATMLGDFRRAIL
ncbi:2-oxo acid dehydrogenase subunit E2 [Agrobacterium sp. MCAB5]|uniref:2-oxo acid dehydrogenase subunit E2 n=1 Tax=Agrobacterium sp. MCAB5 TaxID=3233042 RepID=UPI003F925580